MQLNEEFLNIAIQAVIALIIALVSSWATVQLSFRRFRSERLWDKKAQSYERLIDAFHKAKKFSIEHIDAHQKGEHLSQERIDELRKIAKEAQEEIQRMADIGSFTISNKAIVIVQDYQTDTDHNEHTGSFIESLENNYDIICKHMSQIIAEAKADLIK